MHILHNFSVLMFFSFLFASGISQAAQYQVEIRQINPDKWVYNASCDSEKMCHVYMGVVPQNGTFNTDDLELDVGVFIKNQEVYLQFKSENEYFYSKDEKKIISLPYSSKEKMAIYKRSPAAESDPEGKFYNLLVVRPSKNLLAELEISITPE